MIHYEAPEPMMDGVKKSLGGLSDERLHKDFLWANKAVVAPLMLGNEPDEVVVKMSLDFATEMRARNPNAKDTFCPMTKNVCPVDCTGPMKQPFTVRGHELPQPISRIFGQFAKKVCFQDFPDNPLQTS